jgi:hypothetical protein
MILTFKMISSIMNNQTKKTTLPANKMMTYLEIRDQQRL